MFKIGDRFIHHETSTNTGTIVGHGTVNQVTGQLRWLVQFDNGLYDDEGDCHVVYEKNMILLVNYDDILKGLCTK